MCHHYKVPSSGAMWHHMVVPHVSIRWCHMSTSGGTTCHIMWCHISQIGGTTFQHIVVPHHRLKKPNQCHISGHINDHISSHITILVTMTKSSCGTLYEFYLHIWLTVGKYLYLHISSLFVCVREDFYLHISNFYLHIYEYVNALFSCNDCDRWLWESSFLSYFWYSYCIF